MFESFQNLVPQAARRFGVAKEVEAATICQYFRVLLPDLFPEKENVHESLQPAFFKQGALVINARTPAWSQEVIMRKSKILEEINKKAGCQTVKNLRTQLKFDQQLNVQRKNA